MPRIDPEQLLTCLQVLLTPTGGILSKDEVQRLASLMTKFSKKLVSKCVYILILKNTEETLLGAFMGAGGWTLAQIWLHDAMFNQNWALVKELLELLLMTPVDTDRLKANNIPKMVKSLSKREDLEGINELSDRLVQQWLKIVKGEHSSNAQSPIQVVTPITEQMEVVEVPVVHIEESSDKDPDDADNKEENIVISAQTFYKLLDRDGKKVLCKVSPNDANYTVVENAIIEEVHMEDLKEKEEIKKDKSKHEKSKHRSSSNSKSSSSSSSSSSSRDKDKNKESHRSSKDKHSSKYSKDKDKDRRDKSKDRHRNNGSVKHGSSSGSKSSSSSSKDKKESKEKQAEKDKDTLAKLQPQSLQKLPKIPKKQEDKGKEKKEEPKKGSISIEVRKPTEERPKTVKVFNSKVRLTGLEEEPKPALPRTAVKKPATTALPTIPVKRPSPPREIVPGIPPEKKTKIDPAERPGAIKLIPPKPKPPVLQESDMFMDALTASATTKKEPKKRKRRASVSKDSTGSPPQGDGANQSNNTAASSPVTSPSVLKNITPPNFYQDTLSTDDSKSKSDDEKEVDEAEPNKEHSTTGEPVLEDLVIKNANGLRGVLVHVKRKGPKKSIRWKPDEELVDVQYFELDETERVNVTKAFGDMAKMDVRGEREALQMSRKLPNEDMMDAQTMWKIPYELDLTKPLAEPGCKSLEKSIQFAREKSVLQAIFFSPKMVPDSPAEPDAETHPMVDPVIIPIDDPENAEQTQIAAWPDPKSSPLTQTSSDQPPQLYPQNMQGPFSSFGMTPPPNFQNVPPFSAPPSFMPPNAMPNEWTNPPMMNHNMPPPDMMNPAQMNPTIFGPGMDGFNPMMGDNSNAFQGQFNPNMFPHNFRGRGGFRPRGNPGPWFRMTGPMPNNTWSNQGRGGPPINRGGRICKNVKIYGHCRNRDNCHFVHPMN